MILSCDSDAAYLVATKSRSRAGGYHYLGNKDGKQFNGPVYVLAKIINAVMASAAEAEVGALYMNAQELSPMRTTLEELDHPQPPTPLRTDNSTADGIMNKTIKQRQSKAMDKRFYWVQDRVEQGEFRLFQAPGKDNLDDWTPVRVAQILWWIAARTNACKLQDHTAVVTVKKKINVPHPQHHQHLLTATTTMNMMLTRFLRRRR